MKAYVAGRFSDWQDVRLIQDVLRSNGYAITYDWTVHAEPKGAQVAEWKGTLSTTAQLHAAVTDLDAAATADLLVLLCKDAMSGALGCFVEFGAAATNGAELHVIAPHRGSIFWHLPTAKTFRDFADWAQTFELYQAAA